MCSSVTNTVYLAFSLRPAPPQTTPLSLTHISDSLETPMGSRAKSTNNINIAVSQEAPFYNRLT